MPPAWRRRRGKASRRREPDERPFVLSRSAAAGSSRWTALWTGDNWSNWHHLRLCIPGTLNLALSGIPFNGPDVPGFGGHADAELAIAWYKAGMLFPFLRNHACKGSVAQEPWQFGPDALAVIRHYVRLRYKLLPYLYQLWVAQAREGTAVMRPLFHDFDSADGLDLDRIDDQFLVGPAADAGAAGAPGPAAAHRGAARQRPLDGRRHRPLRRRGPQHPGAQRRGVDAAVPARGPARRDAAGRAHDAVQRPVATSSCT